MTAIFETGIFQTVAATSPLVELNNRARTVAIVGGGASGALVAVGLMKAAAKPLNVIIIEPSAKLGRGIAYATTCPMHLLNVPAGAMSAYPDAPDHFVNWLRENVDAALTPESFVERRLYGDYIESELRQAEIATTPRVRLRHVLDWVKAARCNEHGAVLELAGGARIAAHSVVLALGNPPPSNPIRGAGADTVRTAWPAPRGYQVQKQDSVLLIGSGLTAVDAALSLNYFGHRGKIHMVSRHGLWPLIHPEYGAPLRSFTNVDDLTRSVRRLTAALRFDAASVTDDGGSWCSIVDGLRACTSEIWKRLDSAERRRFLSHLQPYWDIHRHRMAPEVARRFAAMCCEGRVVLHAGRIVETAQAPNGLMRVIVKARGRRETLMLEVARIINCTGPQTDYRAIAQPLIHDLFAQGVAAQDELKLGLLTGPDGALLGEDGLASRTFFTLGPPRKGTLWETTAMPEIRLQASVLARRLLGDGDDC